MSEFKNDCLHLFKYKIELCTAGPLGNMKNRLSLNMQTCP